jgi:hypothetical protein
MVSVPSLWLPILASAVVVFLISFVLHMVLKYHSSDCKALPNEDAVMDALRKFNIPPGDYGMPRPANSAAMKDPAFIEKTNKGPVVLLTVMPNGPFKMGPVFRFAGCTAFVGYSLALWQDSIWYKKQWSTTIKNTFDGLVYALFTGGVFGAMWPK